MLPWSNRISGGGFEHAGRFHPIAPNRGGEPYPIPRRRLAAALVDRAARGRHAP